MAAGAGVRLGCRRLAAIADLVVYEVSIQVIEKVGEAGFFADSLAAVPHRVGQGRVPRCARNLVEAEWFPFSWAGEIFGCRQAPWLARALDPSEQGDGTVKTAGLEVRGYGNDPPTDGPRRLACSYGSDAHPSKRVPAASPMARSTPRTCGHSRTAGTAAHLRKDRLTCCANRPS